MNKLVFITGASSGIGQALALRFYQAGWNVALVARRTQAIQDWAQNQQLDSKRYGVYGADVAQIDSIVQAGQACLAAQGLPDLVIANAGVSIGVDSAMREDLDVLSETLMINNVGMAATFHPFINGMKARGSGVLVGIASMAASRLRARQGLLQPADGRPAANAGSVEPSGRLPAQRPVQAAAHPHGADLALRV